MNQAWIRQELERLKAAGLERQLKTFAPACATTGKLINFAGNDYLNLAANSEIHASAIAALKRWGSGSASSRLLAGNFAIYEELEKRLANLKRYPAALLFGSGYMANVGIIPALAGINDWLVVDRLAHASIIDAALLSRAVLKRFRHNDLQHLESILKQRPAKGRCLIVTESVFSMDGDCAPLAEIADLAATYSAMLMVDEAHATGVFGPGGAGIVAARKLEKKVHISMGTLSKALGAYGGFCACAQDMRKLLINKARSLIFSTAPAPAAAGAALGALDYLQINPDAGKILLDRARNLRAQLKEAGFDTGSSISQIIPVILGDNQKALEAAAELLRQGIIAPAIRPPTVPQGTARLRISLTLAHTPEDLERAASVLIKTLTKKKS